MFCHKQMQYIITLIKDFDIQDKKSAIECQKTDKKIKEKKNYLVGLSIMIPE